MSRWATPAPSFPPGQAIAAGSHNSAALSTGTVENLLYRGRLPETAVLCRKSFPVESRADLPERQASVSPFVHQLDAGLLTRILNQRAIAGELIAVADAANSFTLGDFVLQRRASALAD